MPSESRSSIRVLLTLLVLAVAGPLASMGVYFGYRYQVLTRESAEELLLERARTAAGETTQFLKYSERLLSRMVEEGDVDFLDPARCVDHFPELAQVLTPVFVSIDLWAEDGSLVCSTLENPPINLVASQGFGEALAAGGFRISRVFREERTQRWSTALTLPVRMADGRMGIISALVDLVRFQEILVEFEFTGSDVLTLAQGNGIVVARSVDPEGSVGRPLPGAGGDYPADSVLVDVVVRAPSREGVDFAWGRVRVRNSDWVLFAGLPADAVYGSVSRRRAQTGAFGLLVLLLTAFSSLFVYRRVTAPLQGLVDGLAVAQPGTTDPLDPEGPREIAWVAERFNQAWNELNRVRDEQLRSDQRLRSLVENAVVGIFIVTDSGQFLEVNDALVSLLGFDSREELIATPAAALYIDPEEREAVRVRAGDARIFRGIPARWVKRDGTMIRVRLSGRNFEINEGQVVREVIVEDVTEISRLQAQVAQTQKMEALGRLAGGIAHDFNNLLTIVLGQADLLRDDPDLSEGQREQVSEIFEASARGAALNHQLLAFGRGRPADPQGMDLNVVIAASELILRRALGESVHLEIDLGGEAPVLADRSQMEQVILNLAVNARDAMPDGGRLSVSTSLQEVTADEVRKHAGAQLGEHVVMEVRDSGEGIPEEVLPFIFEPFFSTKSATKGTGLGLATVYGVISGLGGHVRVRSEWGVGTAFSVFLPRHMGSVDEVAAGVRRTKPQLGAGRILLVEDESGVRRFIAQVLQKAGYQVTAATDGLEAIQMAQAAEQPHFDLLVSDIVMPGLGGHEVATRLAQDGVLDRALLISGYPEGLPDGGPEGLADWAFLAKPFTSHDLLEAVRRLISPD